jgi:ABC-type branched-subunit amino acid transport system ATPase component
VLTTRGLTAGYGKVQIIRDVSVDVGRGEVVAIVGPNGAGKSTLLKAIMGLIHVWEGELVVGDTPAGALATDELVRRGVGYVPQIGDVFTPLSVSENLDIGAYTLAQSEVAKRRQEVIDVFPRVGTLLDRTAGKLSGGERKMVGIARALMIRPSVLLLDEPTAGLSAEVANTLFTTHLEALRRLGVGVLLVEQKAAAALDAADWSYVMASGRVGFSARARELRAHPRFSDIFFGLIQPEAQVTRVTADAGDTSSVTTEGKTAWAK